MVWSHDDFIRELSRQLVELEALRKRLEEPGDVGEIIKRIEESPLEELVVTDSIPLRPEAKDCAKLRVESIAPLISEAIRRINNEESVSSLFI